jgi:GDPmannose 4,6-dehydratase
MINLAFRRVGMELSWTGEGVETIASDQDGNIRVKTNPRFFRPAEVDILVGNSEKASRELGWTPKTGFEELIFMMVDNDMEIVRTAIKHEVNPPSPLY